MSRMYLSIQSFCDCNNTSCVVYMKPVHIVLVWRCFRLEKIMHTDVKSWNLYRCYNSTLKNEWKITEMDSRWIKNLKEDFRFISHNKKHIDCKRERFLFSQWPMARRLGKKRVSTSPKRNRTWNPLVQKWWQYFLLYIYARAILWLLIYVNLNTQYLASKIGKRSDAHRYSMYKA